MGLDDGPGIATDMELRRRRPGAEHRIAIGIAAARIIALGTVDGGCHIRA